MFVVAVLLCCLGALVTSTPQKVFYDVEKADIYFEDFVQKYNIEYKSKTEKQVRFDIFKNNLVKINALNQKDEHAVHAINMFTDLTQEEFNKKYNGYRPEGAETKCLYIHGPLNETRLAAPPSFDWRVRKVVTSVKSQGDCLSCWAFATAATMEGQYAMKYNRLVDFSEQQLLDCCNHLTGCTAGYFITNGIIDTARNVGGIMTAQEYIYEAKMGQCRVNRNRLAAKVVDCRQFMLNSEDELKEALVQYGPLAISVNAEDWAAYTSGIHDCNGHLPNHAVLVVGYGSENGQQYWIIKNSYGATFGENGYIRLKMYGLCNPHKYMVATAVIG